MLNLHIIYKHSQQECVDINLIGMPCIDFCISDSSKFSQQSALYIFNTYIAQWQSFISLVKSKKLLFNEQKVCTAKKGILFGVLIFGTFKMTISRASFQNPLFTQRTLLLKFYVFFSSLPLS